ncbi:hypothetical protein [Luxibacter massiliensis]|uniref:hypothetical protein n=1 Tax=Luxibacter massiliensis TaxID=2219695 RepID=UPI000F06914B|nr:hypothetical protein [Luxibacter massiliensis]
MEKTKMRFSCLVKKGVSEIRERPLEEMKEDQVLVKQLACNICTTDVGRILRTFKIKKNVEVTDNGKIII